LELLYAINNNAVDLLDKIEKDAPRTTTAVPKKPSEKKAPIAVQEPEPEDDFFPEDESEAPPEPVAKPAAQSGRNIKAQLALYNNTDRVKKVMDDLVDEDMHNLPQKTSVVTLYSAKGGVGRPHWQRKSPSIWR
jgi:hypothetical protein